MDFNATQKNIETLGKNIKIELSAMLDNMRIFFVDFKQQLQQLTEIRGWVDQLRHDLQVHHVNLQGDHQVALRLSESPGRPPATCCAPEASPAAGRGGACLFTSVQPESDMQPTSPVRLPVSMSTVHAEQQRCPVIQRILHSIGEGCEDTSRKYAVSAGVVYRKTQSGQYRLYIPSTLVEAVLRAYTQPEHQGLFKTFYRLHSAVFWPNLWSSLKSFMRASPKTDTGSRGQPSTAAPCEPAVTDCGAVQDINVCNPTAALVQSSDKAEELYSLSVFKMFHTLVPHTRTSSSDDGPFSTDSSEDEADIMCYPGW